MSAGKFKVSYPAIVQVALLAAPEKAALTKLFSSSELDQPTVTRPAGEGRFVSRLGEKRVLWRRTERRKPEILSIVDKSYAQA